MINGNDPIGKAVAKTLVTISLDFRIGIGYHTKLFI